MKLELTLEQTAKGFSLRCSRSDGAELNRNYENTKRLKADFPGLFLFLTEGPKKFGTTPADLNFTEEQIGGTDNG